MARGTSSSLERGSPPASAEEQADQLRSSQDGSILVMSPRAIRRATRGTGIQRTGYTSERHLEGMNAEERQEYMLQQKRARHARLYTVCQPIEIPDKEAFVGFTLFDVVLHEGASVVLPDYARPVCPPQVNKLQRIAKADGSGLRTRDHEHRIAISVDIEQVDLTSVTTAPYGHHVILRFNDGVSGSKVTLIQGQNRREVSRKLAAEQVDELQRLQAVEKKLLEAEIRDQGKLDQTRRKMEDLKTAMEAKCVWLATVYDQAKLQELQRHSPTAMLKLLTNNRLAPAQDSEDHHLKVAFRFAFQSGARNMAALLEYSQTLDQRHLKSLNRLVHRGRDFMDFVISTRVSRQFDNFFTQSERVVSVQEDVWGLVSPIFTSMLQQLVYICSDTPIPTPDDDFGPQFCNNLFEIVINPPPDANTSTLLLDALVALADDEYTEHLSEHVRKIGTPSEEWTEAFRDYRRDMIVEFGYAIDSILSDTNRPVSDIDKEVAAQALTKLKYILKRQAVWKADESPRIHGNMPLLSPICATAMLDDWVTVKDALYIISNLLVPALSLIQIANTGRGASSAPFSSYPSAILHYIRYWLGYRTHPSWDQLDGGVEEMIQAMHGEEEDGEQGASIVQCAFYSVLETIWEHREAILRPAQNIVPPPPRYTASGTREVGANDPVFHENLTSAGATFLAQWLNVVTREKSIIKEHASPRHHQRLPQCVKTDIQEWQDTNHEDRFLPIFRALQCSSLNFLASFTGPTNNRPHHANALALMDNERHYWRETVYPHLELLPSFSSLLTFIVSTIRDFEGLGRAPLWFDLPETSGELLPIDESEFEELFVRKERDSRLAVFEHALNTFIKRIGAQDCLGILPHTSPKKKKKRPGASLHLGLKQAVVDLCCSATSASHHLSLITRSENLVDWPMVSDEWEDVDEGDGRVVEGLPFATRSDISALYREGEVRKARSEEGNLEDGNGDIDADAEDEKYGDIQEMLSRKRGDDDDPQSSQSPSKRRRSSSIASSHR
ncbi:hypothetical protein NMY22_g9301 [Coprinellus aureogranulatus]|nr:hypothetical protein NMY22_g9301 [Coprinellus aureogranulatus]